MTKQTEDTLHEIHTELTESKLWNKFNKIERLYDKIERLKKPKYHENGRKKRTTKADKIALENTEKKYWAEHYRLFPGDRPKKRGRKPNR